MLIKRFVFNDFRVNTYLVADEASNIAVIMDPGMYTERERIAIDELIKQYKFDVAAILLTHGHFDHWLGVSFFQQRGIKVMMNKADEFVIEKSATIAPDYNISIGDLPKIDEYLIDGQIISFGPLSFRVIHTPGHSPGHVCFQMSAEKVIFTGDLLFKNTIGRTDIPAGDYDQIVKSLKEKILTIKEDYTVFPGHGSETSIVDEILNNPFVQNIINV